MFEALVNALQSNKINIIDTCPNFRYGKSQKVINSVLNYLIKQKQRKRQQFFISSKIGYIPHDIDSQLTDQDFIKILKQNKILTDDDIIANCHSIHPNFIDFSLQKSRLSLGLKTIDVVYLNNYPETQLPIIGYNRYFEQLEIAFKKLQQARLNQMIRYYGICSFVCFRSPPEQQQIHINLQKMINIAKKVGGDNHGFRFIMLPINLGMPQALLKWQQYIDKDTNIQSKIKVLDVAEKQQINVVICSPLFQGRLSSIPFSSTNLSYLTSNSAKHLQLIRSINSKAILSTLVGQNTLEHINQNLQVTKFPKLTAQQWNSILPIQ